MPRPKGGQNKITTEVKEQFIFYKTVYLKEVCFQSQKK